MLQLVYAFPFPLEKFTVIKIDRVATTAGERDKVLWFRTESGKEFYASCADGTISPSGTPASAFVYQADVPKAEPRFRVVAGPESSPQIVNDNYSHGFYEVSTAQRVLDQFTSMMTMGWPVPRYENLRVQEYSHVLTPDH